MKDIGKITGTYFFVIAALSILSMPVAYFFQNIPSFEFTWIFMLVLGIFLWKHNNPARIIVVGFNILGLLLSAGIFLFSFFDPAIQTTLFSPEKLSLFAVEIPNPSLALVAAFMALTLESSVALITLLLSKKAKEEFSSQ